MRRHLVLAALLPLLGACQQPANQMRHAPTRDTSAHTPSTPGYFNANAPKPTGNQAPCTQEADRLGLHGLERLEFKDRCLAQRG